MALKGEYRLLREGSCVEQDPPGGDIVDTIAGIWGRIQARLFPFLEECLDEPSTSKLYQLVAILELLRVEEAVGLPLGGRGRPRHDRQALARAFVAKAVYNLPTTELLVESLRSQPNLRQVCGFPRRRDVPSAATFSRAFAEFAASGLADRVHATLIAQHLQGERFEHIARDSTEIEAREKPQPAPPPEPKVPRPMGRPRKGAPPPAPRSRLERQLQQTPEEAFGELSLVCGRGCKRDSHGHPHYWIGYKAHLDVTDDMLPITMLTTSAHVHDSQVAIPLAKLTAQRVTAQYELMDAAYDAGAIYQAVQALGHEPIIEPQPHTRCRPPLEAADKCRLQARGMVERVYARLKDEFGGRQVRVRGHAKVHAHLMFGILALFADQLLKLVT